MSIIFFLIIVSILVAAGFLGAFVWAVRSGQYEDTCTPSMRLLTEERLPGSGGVEGSARKQAARSLPGQEEED